MSTVHQKLYKYGLQAVSVCDDGNCFFAAVASGMLSNLKVWHGSLSLAGLTIDSELTLSMVTTALRHAFCKRTIRRATLSL